MPIDGATRTELEAAAFCKDESREAVYGMPYEQWKSLHQKEASSDQLAAMAKVHKH